MKSSRSRAPSPSVTSFSGISNYRTESYHPLRDKNVPPVPQIDHRSVLEGHFTEFSRYLAAYLAKPAPDLRTTARLKLGRLTIQQFHELSTDVYDEVIRKKDEKEGRHTHTSLLKPLFSLRQQSPSFPRNSIQNATKHA
ncbi:hypothetical protein B0H10DRAFT_106705 [Mycena sp. CBHHK59/15]|nr:hypothetical protein B0H10DRAFT_106705 [Mycena sp. CBHHK59/15]